jgi:hypothetical protein
MAFLVAIKTGHLPLGGTVPGNVAFFLAVEATIAASLGALARKVSVLATLETFGGGAATATALQMDNSL